MQHNLEELGYQEQLSYVLFLGTKSWGSHANWLKHLYASKGISTHYLSSERNRFCVPDTDSSW